MGFSSIRLKTLSPAVRQFLQQPAAISAIASLGVHALLFAVLPVLPYAAIVEEEEPDIRQSVEVVELSPEEQARLPEFPTSQIDLPPLLQDSLPSAVTDLPPLPVPGQSTSPPSADDLFSDPFFTSSLPNFSIPTLPPAIPYPPAPPVQPRPQQPAPTQPPASQPEPSSQPSPDQPGELPRLPIGDLLNPPREQSGNERTPANEENVAANSESATPQPETPTESPAAAPPRSDEEIVAALRQDVEARRRRIAVQQQLAYSQTGTANDSDYNPGRSWTAWTDQLQKEFGIDLTNIDREAKTTIEAPFPPEVCEFVPELNQELVQEGISADFGVVVDPDGKPIGGLSVLRSSGYDFFNSKGGEAVEAGTFDNDTGKNVPYLVTVVFPYSNDSCSGNAEEPVSLTP